MKTNSAATQPKHFHQPSSCRSSCLSIHTSFQHNVTSSTTTGTKITSREKATVSLNVCEWIKWLHYLLMHRQASLWKSTSLFHKLFRTHHEGHLEGWHPTWSFSCCREVWRFRIWLKSGLCRTDFRRLNLSSFATSPRSLSLFCKRSAACRALVLSVPKRSTSQ